MGDSGTIDFTATVNGEETVFARVYVHWRGSDADVWFDEFAEFIEDEKRRHEASRRPALDPGASFAERIDAGMSHYFETGGERDLRWHDPSYLAARFVAWAAKPDGLGIGLLPTSDDRYLGNTHWEVDCELGNYEREPVITRVR